ncbi:MAG: Wzz/FepE/Etk N-terminal domain-containing protein [Hyphomicrobium sp.]
MLNTLDDNARQAVPSAQRTATGQAKWSVRMLLSILWWRRGALASAMALCLAAASLYVLVATRAYTATAAVVLDTKMTPPSPVERSPEVLVDMSVVESQVEALRSDRVALAAIRKLGLQDDPEFSGEKPGILSWVLAAVGLRSGGGATSDEVQQQIVLGAFKRGVEIERVGRSYVTTISFTSRNAETAAKAANALADAYIAEQIEGGLEVARRNSTWMEERVGDLRERAVAATGAVEDFKTRESLIVDAKGKLASETELNELATSLARARAETAQAQAKLERVTAVLGESAGAGRSYNVELEIARGNEEALQKRMGELFQQAASDRGKLAKLQDLDSKSQAYKAIYDAFLGQYTRAVQQQSFPTTEARVLTPAATPISTSKPRTNVILFLSAVMGAGLGVALAFAREFLADPVRSPEQVEQELGLACVGSVPNMPRVRSMLRWPGRPLRLVDLRSRSKGTERDLATEAFRCVRVAIDQRHRREGACVVAFVSPRDGEGKSTSAYNFAVLTAGTGSRTLLINADLRHRRSWGRSKSDGLLAVLEGEISLDMAVIPQEENLDLLAPEQVTSTSDPTTLLGSKAVSDLIATARKEYDYVVVDTTSLLPRADTRVMLPYFDSAVLVAEWGRTALADLNVALRSTGLGATRVAGVLLNKCM